MSRKSHLIHRHLDERGYHLTVDSRIIVHKLRHEGKEEKLGVGVNHTDRELCHNLQA